MKIKTVTQASTIVSVSAGVVVLAASFVAGAGIWALLAAAVAGVAVFFITRTVLRRFIIYKIKPLYEFALARDIPMDRLRRHFDERGMISKMEAELAMLAERGVREMERLKESEIYRREFMGNVSHEMKTPVFTVQGYIMTLLDGGLDDPSVNRNYLERAAKGIERLIDILHDLDEISKLESGAMILHSDCFDVEELAREIAREAEIEAVKTGIKISVGKTHGVAFSPVWVTADQRYIARVLSNLVINSIRYGSDGGHTRISFVDMFDKVMVEVSDDGIGIAPEDVSRVFERFYRVDKSRSRDNGGTGLGLAIVKHIIEVHGQKITLRSEPGKGSTFSFTLNKRAPDESEGQPLAG